MARSSGTWFRRPAQDGGEPVSALSPAPDQPTLAEPSAEPADRAVRLDETIARVALLALAAGCFLVLWPFLLPILWAVILCFSTWPLFRRVEGWLGGRRTLAAVAMVLGLAAILVVPLIILGNSLSGNIAGLRETIRSVMADGLPAAPPWLGTLPLFGQNIAVRWQELSADSAALAEEVHRLLPIVRDWLLTGGLSLVTAVLQLSLSLLIALFLYRDGVTMAGRLEAALHRIAGDRAAGLLTVAGGTTQGVVYGILGSCLAQGILAGFGFWLAGVPGALFLGLLTFFLSLVPFGPILVWLPAALWLFSRDETGWGAFVVLWGLLVVGTVDNFIKPLFICRGGALPFILVLLGVLGGALAFGFIGIFVGPTLLAIGYSLLKEWSSTTTA